MASVGVRDRSLPHRVLTSGRIVIAVGPGAKGLWRHWAYNETLPNDFGTRALTDPGLRQMLTWVFAALVAVVLFAVAAVELTIRWFG